MTALQRRDRLDIRQPFSRADARAAGLPLSTLLGGEFQKILYDSYVSAGIRITLEVRARAALKVSSLQAHISHHTAAELWGAAVPATSAVHIWQPSALRRSVRQGIKAHYGGPQPVTTVRHGIPIATPEQAFRDLAAAGVELVDLVVAGDALIKAGSTSCDRLTKAAEQMEGRGVRTARRAAGLVRPGVDSPMETRLRLLVVFAGLPEPEVNLIIRGADGEWLRRFDLAYRGLRLAIEYDGRQHADDDIQWQRDIHRREELDHTRWRLVLVTSPGIYRNPQWTLERVRQALLDCGASDVPARFRAEWRRHFPGA